MTALTIRIFREESTIEKKVFEERVAQLTDNNALGVDIVSLSGLDFPNLLNVFGTAASNGTVINPMRPNAVLTVPNSPGNSFWRRIICVAKLTSAMKAQSFNDCPVSSS